MLAERVFVKYLNGPLVWCCCVFQKLLLDWRQHTKKRYDQHQIGDC